MTSHAAPVGKCIDDVALCLRLPKLEPPRFEGDPEHYQEFIIAFDTLIAQHTVDKRQRLLYLLHYLDGFACEVISGCVYLDPECCYDEARHLLEHEFGSSLKVAMSFANRLMSFPAIASDDGRQLRSLSVLLNKCTQAMCKIPDLSMLNDAYYIQCVVRKLPGRLQEEWCVEVSQTRRLQQRVVFEDLRQFVYSASEALNHPVFGVDAMSLFATQSSTSHGDGVGTQQRKDAEQVTCVFCESFRDLDNCERFARLSYSEKRKFLFTRHLCFACYGSGHVSRSCTDRRTCHVCGGRHPSAMHVNT